MSDGAMDLPDEERKTRALVTRALQGNSWIAAGEVEG